MFMIRLFLICAISYLFFLTSCKSREQKTNTFFFQNYDDAIIADYDILLPKPLGWTSDYSDLFNEDQIKYLDSLCEDYEKRTTVEIAIVTIPSFMTSEKNLTDFTKSILNG